MDEDQIAALKYALANLPMTATEAMQRQGAANKYFEEQLKMGMTEDSYHVEPVLSLTGMIAARLGIHPSNPLPFDFIQAHHLTPDRVVVFVVNNGEPAMIEDDALFPSDKLMTQLRLLRGQ